MFRHHFAITVAVSLVAIACGSAIVRRQASPTTPPVGNGLRIVQDDRTNTLAVARAGQADPILTVSVPPDGRPSLGPIGSPAGGRVPGDGLHFYNPQDDRWRRVSVAATEPAGPEVRWQTVYELLDSSGSATLVETARWSMREQNGTWMLGLEWRGEAKADVPGRYDFAGLTLRVPWGASGTVVNAARQRNGRAEGQRAMWIDVGVTTGGTEPVHVAVFDYPDNTGYPTAWRADPQMGIGTARARPANWTIRKGDTEIVRQQFVIYRGALNDVQMDGAWTEYSGNRSTYSTAALWGIAQREGRDAKFLTAEQAVAEMSVIDGYRVNAWAAEPMIAQPMAFCWDDRGRLWVAENRDYESRGDGFSRAGTSDIVILEDTDRDGRADKRTVFMEGIIFPSAIAVGFDGAFVGAPPNLLFVPDRNHDDRADTADIEVRLTGWGINDRHEVLNSLHWGPDGWLYGLEGYATSSRVRKPTGKGPLFSRGDPFPQETDSEGATEINGGVWRYHPTRDIFEVVAHGFSNPWGIDYDAKGQLFISACVIPHLFHVVPGGIYHRQGGRHFNPYVYGDIPTIADHRHRSAHGGARVYQSDAFPASQQGRLFMANIHEHALLSDVLERKGSSFVAHHGDDFLLANNAQWIGFSVEIGPDGAVYVLDWHDSDICGTDVLNKETGRIFRVAPVKSLAESWPGRYGDLGAMTDGQLVDLQSSRSDWHARRARVILQSRAARGLLASGTHQQLDQLFQSSPNPDWRLRAMWALHVTGGWTPDGLVRTLNDPDEHVRAWAVQLLSENRAPPQTAVDAFARMARDDRSAVVRVYLAAALQRLDPPLRWNIAAGLIAHAEDAEDQNLPKMIWVGVEPLVTANPALALDHAARSRLPLVARFIARRAVDADAIDVLVAAIEKAPETDVNLLEGLRDGLEGRYDVQPPPSWSRIYRRLERADPAIARLAADIAQRFGDTDTTTRNLKIVRSGSASIDERRKALQTLTIQRRPQLTPILPSLLEVGRLRADAIRAIAAYDDESLGKLLVARYATFSQPERVEAIQTLSSRARYGRLLTDALAADAISRRDVPPHVARQLRRIVGARFADVWGPVDPIASEERAYARYRGILNDAALKSANVQNGRTAFLQTCGPCHKMYGEGGTVGPDLTGSNRSNLEYLLSNVLNPNGDVPEAYRMVVVSTRDGRTLAGNVIAETDRQITLRVVGRDNVVVSKSDIQSREATATSMMPTGLFDSFTDREVIDLVAYLRTVEPVKVP